MEKHEKIELNVGTIEGGWAQDLYWHHPDGYPGRPLNLNQKLLIMGEELKLDKMPVLNSREEKEEYLARLELQYEMVMSKFLSQIK